MNHIKQFWHFLYFIDYDVGNVRWQRQNSGAERLRESCELVLEFRLQQIKVQRFPWIKHGSQKGAFPRAPRTEQKKVLGSVYFYYSVYH